MARKRIVVIGAGGFAREVKWLIQGINDQGHEYDVRGFVVSDLAKLGPRDSVEDVLGDLGWLEENRREVDALAIGIGTPAIRARIGLKVETMFPELEWPALVHPTVVIDLHSTRLGRGVIVCANVTATVNVVFGDYSVVNLCCTIGHEAVIGAGSVVNPTVNISGGVILEDEVLVGTGAQIMQYIRVGRGARIGAGAVVTRDVVAGETVVGIPARPLATKAS